MKVENLCKECLMKLVHLVSLTCWLHNKFMMDIFIVGQVIIGIIASSIIVLGCKHCCSEYYPQLCSNIWTCLFLCCGVKHDNQNQEVFLNQNQESLARPFNNEEHVWWINPYYSGLVLTQDDMISRVELQSEHQSTHSKHQSKKPPKYSELEVNELPSYKSLFPDSM